MRLHPTQPEIPAVRSKSFANERSAVYRRRTVSRPPDPIANLVEEVVNSPDDPRREE